MSEPFLGEIRMFAGNFAPSGWALCEGQLLAISQNDALFSLLGTTYGGDGETTFGLPDMQGRLPLHAGNGPGLSPRRLGSRSGQETVALTVNQIPAHSHPAYASGVAATESGPGGRFPGTTLQPTYHDSASGVAVDTDKRGGSQAHSNLPPYLCLNFIIALFGIYPS